MAEVSPACSPEQLPVEAHAAVGCLRQELLPEISKKIDEHKVEDEFVEARCELGSAKGQCCSQRRMNEPDECACRAMCLEESHSVIVCCRSSILEPVLVNEGATEAEAIADRLVVSTSAFDEPAPPTYSSAEVQSRGAGQS